MTEWQDHPRYHGSHQVTSDGRIRSLTREVNSSYGKRRTVIGRELTPTPGNDGRLFVCLNTGGKQKCERVHRLVLETFTGPCPDGMECRHLDGDASNNHISNLRWGTHKENESDKIAHGTRAAGERQGSSKLTEWDVRWIKRFTKRGFATQEYLADIFGVCQAQISRIATGREWSWLEV